MQIHMQTYLKTTFDDVLNDAQCTETVSKQTESYYTYEFNENEQKDQLKY